MPREYHFFVYMVSNYSGTVLYTGVTNDLPRRLWEHQTGEGGSAFTKQYHVDRLVFYEHYDEVSEAIAREKQIKGWTRAKKEALVRVLNPQREDIRHRLDLIWQEPIKNCPDLPWAMVEKHPRARPTNTAAKLEGPSTRAHALARDDRARGEHSTR